MQPPEARRNVVLKRTSRVVLGLTAAVLAAACLVPAAATGGTEEPAKAQHVKRVSLHESAAHKFDAHHRVGTDELRHAGRTVGYDSFTEHFNRSKDVFRFALAFRHGQIVGRVVLRQTSVVVDGPILFGTGRFAGIEGTATLKFDGTRQVLILRYQL
jgi:hypothetical protein